MVQFQKEVKFFFNYIPREFIMNAVCISIYGISKLV